MEIKNGVMTREIICLGMTRLESNLTNTDKESGQEFCALSQ